MFKKVSLSAIWNIPCINFKNSKQFNEYVNVNYILNLVNYKILAISYHFIINVNLLLLCVCLFM